MRSRRPGLSSGLVFAEFAVERNTGPDLPVPDPTCPCRRPRSLRPVFGPFSLARLSYPRSSGPWSAAGPYEFIGLGAMDVTKPYKFIGFRAMAVTKPYKFIGSGAI